MDGLGADVTREIAAGLWQTTTQHGHAGLELEFRLGHVLAGGHFSPNVGKDQFAKLKSKLDAAKKFERVVAVETVEKIGNAGGAAFKHVTTLGISTGPPPPPYCMTKHKVYQKDFTVTESPYTTRCGIAMEKVVPLTEAPAGFTRHKRRTRYIYNMWAFDLTTVVSNTDIDTEESYEVEIELLDPGLLFERTMDSIAEYGLSLVQDAVRMLVVDETQ
jgi:hypothetical protein